MKIIVALCIIFWSLVALVSTEQVSVELVDGPNTYSGRVEIIIGNRRGTVCDDSWDDNDASVICRMIGHGGGKALIEANFGQGSSNILLDDVQCNGNEISIVSCRHSGVGVHNCNHNEDAGVICTPICGMRPRFNEQSLKEPWSRIYNGKHASKGQYPWQVYVEIQRVNGKGRCGGTIIDQRWILSAAHCFENKIGDVINVIVRAGADNLTRRDVQEQRFELGLDQIILHPSYNSTTDDYDLALIVLKNDKINVNDNVQPACLPEDWMLYDLGLKCHISGWGQTGWNEGASSVLLGAEVNLVNDSICAHAYQTKRVQITPNMVCAADLANGIDTCQGESGGPLVCNIGGLFYVLGATSFGYLCGEPEHPGVYARISAMLPWIKTMQRYD